MLDNARRLRGIYVVDLDDEEYKEILKNACKNDFVKKISKKASQSVCEIGDCIREEAVYE